MITRDQASVHDEVGANWRRVIKRAAQVESTRMYGTDTLYAAGRRDLHGKPAIGRVDHAFAQQGRSDLSFNRVADPTQLSMLATVVDEYCHQAGIAVGDPARERIGRHIIELFRSGMDKPDELLLALDHHYDEWLGEGGLPSSRAEQAASLASDAAPSPADHPSMSPLRFPQRKTLKKRGF